MDKITINIDPYKTRKKPEKGEKHKFIRINERVAKHKEDLTLEEIIHEVGENRRAFSRAVMKNNQRNGMSFEKQIFLILDFDDNPDPDRFKQKCEDYGLKYTFRYQSLRYSSKNKKFRAIFMLDHWITDSRIAKLMNNILLEIFDGRDGEDLKADVNCKDLARMFLGGKKLIDVFKENRMSVMDTILWALKHKNNFENDFSAIETGLEEIGTEKALGVRDKIWPLLKCRVFRESKKTIQKGKVNVISFESFDTDLTKVLVEIFLKNLWKEARRMKENKITVVIDEFQNLILGRKSSIEQIL